MKTVADERVPFFHWWKGRESTWRKGRCCLWLGQYCKGRRRNVHLEWVLGPRNWLGIRLKWGGGENDLALMLGLWFASFWLSFEAWTTWERHLRWYKSHETGAMWYRGSLTVDLWAHNSGGWSHSDKWWQRRHWFIQPRQQIARRLFGRQKYTTVTTSEQEAQIMMPEGAYPVKVKWQVATWKRPRWRARSFYQPEVAMPTPIPIPGKGENSWDLDDDAIHSVTLAARKQPYTLDEVLTSIRENAVRDRERYGGSRLWRPAPASEQSL